MRQNDRFIITAVLFFIALGLSFDVWNDWSSGAASYHLWIEAFVVLLTFVALIWIWRDNSALRKKVSGISAQLIDSKKESEKWRTEHQTLIHGLGSAIEKQLTQWQLTKTEQDVAVLLLKGLSFKEIADIRNTSEKTVRQHSLKIYEKSNLAGRAELSAFFLEDLLNPIHLNN